MQMNIVVVWDGDYPWDIRVDKICSSLVGAGHHLHVACRNLGRKPLEDKYNGASIHRLPWLPKWVGKLNDAVSFPAFFNPFWLWHIYGVAKQKRADLIIVRDLPMALGAIGVARRLGIPCVLDMAECYPEMLRCTWQFEGRSFRNYFLRNPKLADYVERLALKNIDEVWVMIEEARDRLLRMHVPAAKIVQISNTPVVSRFTSGSARPENDNRRYRLVYVGLLNPSRGVDTVIEAVADYTSLHQDFEFVIAGSGKAEARLKKKVVDLNLTKWVKFLGWVDNARVPELIASADVGIVAHYRCSHWDNTIPNKLFDYMAAGKAVIVSDVLPMKRIVTEAQCGMVYQDHDIKALSRILDAMRDPCLRDRFGQNGRAAVEHRFNWEEEEKILRATVGKFADQLKCDM